MRAALLAALLLTAGAAAQAPPDSLAATVVWLEAGTVPVRPTGRQIARMTTAGTACGLAAGVVTSFLGAVPVGVVLTVAAFPAGAAACVLGTARRDGFGGRYTATLTDAALGAALGAAAGYAVGGTIAFVLIETGAGGGDDLGAAIIGGAVGLTVFVATSAYVAARRVHRHGIPTVAPVALQRPDGTTVPGVALSVGL